MKVKLKVVLNRCAGSCRRESQKRNRENDQRDTDIATSSVQHVYKLIFFEAVRIHRTLVVLYINKCRSVLIVVDFDVKLTLQSHSSWGILLLLNQSTHAGSVVPKSSSFACSCVLRLNGTGVKREEMPDVTKLKAIMYKTTARTGRNLPWFNNDLGKVRFLRWVKNET